MLDTPCFEVVWRVLATHSTRHFPFHFPSRASTCAITFQLDSTSLSRSIPCFLWGRPDLHMQINFSLRKLIWLISLPLLYDTALGKIILQSGVPFTCGSSDRSKQSAVFCRSWDRASLMYSFKYNQQDATLYNILYYCQCSTCFGRFLRPSSGAQELYAQHLVWARLACCYR